jgi:hypothetical protein
MIAPPAQRSSAKSSKRVGETGQALCGTRCARLEHAEGAP